MKTIKRIQSPTPPFFRKLRNTGLAITAIAGVVLTAPVALPAILLKMAGYAAVAGGMASAISQLTTVNEDEYDNE
jgi:hypothetical protein